METRLVAYSNNNVIIKGSCKQSFHAHGISLASTTLSLTYLVPQILKLTKGYLKQKQPTQG